MNLKCTFPAFVFLLFSCVSTNESPAVSANPASTDLSTEILEGVSDEHPYEPQIASGINDQLAQAIKLDDEYESISALVLELDDFAPATKMIESDKVQFGLLHAHTMISDGTGTPADAFKKAKQAGLDFFAVTPHNHAAAEGGINKKQASRRDGVLISKNNNLYNGQADERVTRRWIEADGTQRSQRVTATPLIKAAKDATSSSFVAIYGQEFSTISSGNHVNVFGIEDVLTIENGKHKPFYEYLASLGDTPPVVQMNHPSIANDLFRPGEKPSNRLNDYGFDEYGKSFRKLVATADRFLVLMEMLSGPATVNRKFPKRYSYRNDHEDDYYYYLVQGFHISPSVGHDNHWRHWGSKTPARMGVFSKVSESDLFKAMRANRTYATEDADLLMELICNGEQMGAVLSVPAGSPISCVVKVADTSQPNEYYIADLFYGDVSPQTSRRLVRWAAKDGFQEGRERIGDGQISFPDYLASGKPEFFYVRVAQGDGDRAWSAPVWINHPRNYEVD